MPPDRLLEARKTYAEIAEASRSLSESAAEVERSIASLRREVSRLHDEVDEERRRIRDAVDERAAAIADFRRVLLGEWGWMLLLMVCGGFWGAFLFHAAADGWEWLKAAFLSWWAGGPG